MKHAQRPSRRRAQRGAVLRGVIVVTGLVAAVALQLGGSRLQCRLAGLIGGASSANAAAPSAGVPSATGTMRPRKVAVASAAVPAPAI